MNGVIDNTNGKLQEIRDFAKKTKQSNKFFKMIGSLKRLNKNGYPDCNLWLFPDFAPMSLSFALIKKEVSRPPYSFEDIKLNGGLIYHGEIDNYGSGSAPTFACCIEPTHGWSVHT